MNRGPNDVHDELKQALRREEPPEGFTERVLRRVGEEQIRLKPDPMWDPASAGLNGRLGGSKGPARHGAFVRLAAAASIVAAVAGGIEYRAIQRERAEGEAAKARVTLALHIASSKLQLVQSKINQLHERPSEKGTSLSQ